MSQGQATSDRCPDRERNDIPEAGVLELDLRAQQVELIYAQAPAALGAALAIAMLISFGLWGVVEHVYLLLWSGAQLIQTVLRLGLVYLYRQAPAERRQQAHWSQLYVAGAFAAGIVWGCVGLLFSFSWPVEYQTLVIMGQAGVLAGAISSYAVLLPVYAAFMVPAILIPAQSMIVHGGAMYSNLGLMFIVFAGVLMVIAKNYHRSVYKTLQLRRENSTLLSEMSAANLSLESEMEVRRCAENELLHERQLFTEGPVTVFRWSAADGCPIEYVSGTVSQFGYSAAQLMQEKTPYTGMVHPADLRRLQEAEFVMGKNGSLSRAIDYRILKSDANVRWVYDYTVPIMDDNGDIMHYAGYILDITERKQTEFELQHSRERVQLTLHSIADAVITTDVNGQIEYLNPRAEEITGWESDIARGMPVARVFGLFDDASRQSLEEPILQILSTKDGVLSSEDRILRRNNGEEFNMQYSASPIRIDGGGVLGVIVVLHDVTETRVMERELSYQATHDALTGQINRTEFEAQLGFAMEAARQTQESHVLCCIDIDKLKVVNDTCSHEAGDELICKVANIIQGCLRNSDVLARLAGDEFGVLLRNCSVEGAADLAGRMLAVIHSQRFVSCGHTFEVNASIGIAAINSSSRRVSQVMSEADLACYASKDMGGNRYHVYQNTDKALVQRHEEMRWVSRVAEAIEADRLVLYCQDVVPVVPDATARRHFEVLVRMLDEQGGIIPPNKFLPAAERYNLIASLDRWVVSHCFAWYTRASEIAGADLAVTMGINLSGGSITDAGFLDYIKDEMRNYAVPPAAICFELTETAAIANLGAASEFFSQLRGMGCQFALDDFGSGLSSFSYLKHLPVDYLKIDGSFVKDIETDSVDCAMVKSIQQLGTAIGIKTIAEFVENEGIRKKLADIGVDYAQGYGISRPQPLDDRVIAAQLTA
jgi:diguanylate cyclase (GGDEF)-like protein/PAS domain S-box-containing protein